MTPKQLAAKIFVVEDDESIANVIKYNLQKEGYNVQIIKDGAQAIDAISLAKPDVILLDWMLPNKSGIDICQQLRQQESTSSTPIIMISAKGEDFEKVIGLECGADDYMAKPFCSNRIISTRQSYFKKI